MKAITISEMLPSIREEIEKLIEERIPRENKENTAVLQRIETLAQEISRQNQELRHQRELIQQGFDMTNKRFEDMNRRFEDMKHYADKRFNTLQWMIGIGFTAITILMALFRLYASSSG